MRLYIRRNCKEMKWIGKSVNWNCHDCGVNEGKIHKWNCDMEVCPKCLRQLLSCSCFQRQSQLPFRIPYVLLPVLCRLCGRQNSSQFKVSNNDWKKFVPPPLQEHHLCRFCYEDLKKLFPTGWRNIS